MAVSRFDGWVGYSEGEKLLRTGEELPDDHILVVEQPDLFEPIKPPRAKPGPKPKSQA